MAAPSWFDSLRRSFPDVPIEENNGIKTTEFLEATESLTTLFDLLGSVAFTPVKNDLLGNVKKIREYQLTHVTQSETLQSLAADERSQKKKTATEGLLWLVRGLDFTAQALRHNLNNPTVELAESFRTAYTTTLKPYHSFIVKPIFSAAMSATPYRKDFYAKLGPDTEENMSRLNIDVDALEKRVVILKGFLDRPEIKF
ncbi:Glycolipid transfer protein domain protein [Ascosphaera apis ARSEF 7405]|uniref:Glycolipid transfer protein domain protein n=1 Tax=Ascosphaera apis ARSEF 7405 TaxID=392613 RepID=A0A167YML8_9EURO|nr:Glycolipid transfer protein domain protein [Ascosphaera apis ARSEF 7405]